MKIFNIIKNVIKNIFKTKKQKMIDWPKDYKRFEEKSSIKKKKMFYEQLKVNKKKIETLECINDGLGFQKIKNY